MRIYSLIFSRLLPGNNDLKFVLLLNIYFKSQLWKFFKTRIWFDGHLNELKTTALVIIEHEDLAFSAVFTFEYYLFPIDF